MSRTCRRIRFVLFRIAEGDALPDEALAAARHLPVCTGCRILLAREQRLAGFLDGIADTLPVGEGFLGSVMASLPDGPPPGADRALLRRRRGLRVVGAAGAAAFLAFLLSGLTQPLSDRLAGGSYSLPDFEGSQRLLEGASGVARLVLALLAEAGASLPIEIPRVPTPHLAMAALFPLAAAAFVLASMLALLAAHTLRRDQTRPSVSSLSSSCGAAIPSRAAAEAVSPPSSRMTRRT